MKYSLLIVLNLFFSIGALFAGFDGFDFEDNPMQPVNHGGALLIKKYPQNHPDGFGEQLCLFVGHDRNFNLYAPPAGHVDVDKDFEIKEGKKYYSSLKTIQREVLEETGGLINLGEESLSNNRLLYSQKFHDLLVVVRNDKFSCGELINSVKKTIEDTSKDNAWKEMDTYNVLPIDNVLGIAKIMREHFDNGGDINNLPVSILSPRKSNHNNTPLVYIQTRAKQTVEFCAYYMAAIADTLPQFEKILKSDEEKKS